MQLGRSLALQKSGVATELVIHNGGHGFDDAETLQLFITESGMLHRLKKELPDKTFIAGPTDTCSCNECEYMKKNTLENCLSALENLAPEIILTDEIRRQALVPIERMMALGR